MKNKAIKIFGIGAVSLILLSVFSPLCSAGIPTEGWKEKARRRIDAMKKAIARLEDQKSKTTDKDKIEKLDRRIAEIKAKIKELEERIKSEVDDSDGFSSMDDMDIFTSIDDVEILSSIEAIEIS